METDAKKLRDPNVDWLDRLKTILQQGRLRDRDAGNRPNTKHRSTEDGVKLLLSNLRKGTKNPRDNATSAKDIDAAVFNAVDLLMTDKDNTSGMDKLQALAKFEKVMNEEFAAQSKKGALDIIWKKKIEDALLALRAEEMEELYVNGGASMKDIVFDKGGAEALENIYLRKATTPQLRDRIRTDMLRDKAGCQVLARNPRFGGAVLSSIDPDDLDGLDLEAMFGKAKDDVLAEAVLAIIDSKNQYEQDQELLLKPLLSNKELGEIRQRIAQNPQCDPGLFKSLAKKVNPGRLNDGQGCGARMMQFLWEGGDYDQICDLIRAGVDTTLAARATGEKGKKTSQHAGFVMPLQHIISPFLPEVGKAEAAQTPLQGQAAGAQKIFKTLQKNPLGLEPVTLTKWSDVTESQVIAEFKKNPGTIWGFEKIREPFVDAAKETDQGKRPLRMLDLWDAIQPALTTQGYTKLIDNPDGEAQNLVDKGAGTIRREIHKQKYAHIAADVDGYIAEYEPHVKALLIEFATQMPKGTFIRPGSGDKPNEERKYYDEDGTHYVGVSDVAGIDPSSITSGLACKAGLWWAKKAGDPIYYCLDGINMFDVVDYKLLKNRAIEEFIANGGLPDRANPHREVITMMEVREILKNWDELKDQNGKPIVKFVQKGRMMKPEEVEEFVKRWHAQMKATNKSAGRTPAPPKAQFANELKGIDPRLFDMIPNTPEGDREARDIVKKAGYLRKVANTQPKILLKYIMSKCKVLSKYELITDELISAAAERYIMDPTDKDPRRTQRLRDAIKGCNASFHTQLETALL